MRIIAGILKNVTVPESKADVTHPMSEKLRGAIFNALGDIDGLSVLDGCAGTGMIGFEALSRGASSVEAVEKDDRAFVELRRNSKLALKNLPNAQYRAYHCGIRYFFKRNSGKLYDVIIFDPPYDLFSVSSAPQKINIVQMDHFDGASKHLAPAGIVVFSLPSVIEPPRLPGLMVIAQKTHGVAQLIFYRHE